MKLYHNDAEVDACLDHLPDAGFNVLNWGKQKDIREVKQRVGDRMCLMGNVNPLEIGVRGTVDEVKEATLEVLEGGTERRQGNDPLRRRRHQPGHAAAEYSSRCWKRWKQFNGKRLHKFAVCTVRLPCNRRCERHRR